MVRPVAFGFNAQTATNNAFQLEGYGEQSQENALMEFNNYVTQLQQAGVNVVVVEDTPQPHTPDSIFPNNWFSTHSIEEICFPTDSGSKSGSKSSAKRKIVLYPMYAENRREERNKNVIKALEEYYKGDFEVVDLTEYEKQGMFLEGTGSLILDRENQIAYGCISERTNEEVVERWAEALDYDYCLFEATDRNGTPIYHTNVMMWVGVKYAVVCLDAITDIEERMNLIEVLEETGKEIIEISHEQMEQFAGNMLELQGREIHTDAPSSKGNPHPVITMSKTALESLDMEQLYTLEKYAYIVAPDLDTIEKNGGGSARCMIAELY